MTIFDRALEFVADGMVVGLGSGRASTRFIERLGERVRSGLQIRGVPTSNASAEVAARAGIELTTLQKSPTIDVAVDGADEVDPQLNLIKGYGRAFVREKIIAAAAKKFVVLVGDEKIVTKLGSRGKLPVEVVPFGVPFVVSQLHALGIKSAVEMTGDNPFVSDNGNLILDVHVEPIDAPASFERTLRELPGIVDTGLFLQRADVVLIGDDATFELHAERRRS